jgi:hypothetical protein
MGLQYITMHNKAIIQTTTYVTKTIVVSYAGAEQ